jgi:hypothetical protein
MSLKSNTLILTAALRLRATSLDAAQLSGITAAEIETGSI